MANPEQQFKYAYALSAGSSPNTYVVGQRSGGGANETSAFAVSDVSDGSTDDLTELGDVPGDKFQEHYVIGSFPASFSGDFIGSSADGQSFAGNVQSIFGSSLILFSNDGTLTNGSSITLSNTPFDLVCFVPGTMIGTPDGEVPVEQLAVGDLVTTVAGDVRPIRWLGHRQVDCRRHPRRHDAHPIRVAAHAFGSNLPGRDLYLSPGHPVLVGADEGGSGGHLVPIMCLINGTTVRRVAVDAVTYWHVELDQHDILLAEGLPAESYLDWGDRAFFTEGADHALANPDFVVPGLAGRCRPVALDGPVVEAERRRLDAVFAMRLATACAWPGTEEAERHPA